MQKKNLLIIVYVIITPLAHCQNVGIGVIDPTAKLQVNHRATFTNPSLRLYDSSVNNFGGPVLQFMGNGVNRFNIKGSLESTASPSLSFLDYSYNNSYLAGLSGEGRMMLGALLPLARLTLNHRSSVTDPSLVIFDSSTQSAGKLRFLNAGGSRFWELNTDISNTNRSNQYLDFQTDSSAIITLRGNGRVGINNMNPLYPLDVSGDANFTGALRINGTTGTTGQVLTSNADANPVWRSAPFSNNTRFSMIGIKGATYSTRLQTLPGSYNTNPADIVINSDNIVVNRTGLYHLEGNVHTAMTYFSDPPYAPSYSMLIFNNDNVLACRFTMKMLDGNVRSYYDDGFFSMDLYIVSGQALTFHPDYLTASTPIQVFYTTMSLRGYLISE